MMAAQWRKPTGSFFGKLVVSRMIRSNAPLNEWTISLMDVQPSDYVLEVGFGPGLAIARVAEIASEGFVAGIDFSEAMVGQAQKRNALAIQQGRVTLKQGDALDTLPYGDNTFDKAFSIHVIYFWPELLQVLKELRRVLKVGGVVYIAALLGDESSKVVQMGLLKAYTGEEVVQLLTEAAFSEAWFETKVFDQAPAMCAMGVK
jgi:ubiquinone/menaquinone biosynthesis C-methylase UbiE